MTEISWTEKSIRQLADWMKKTAFHCSRRYKEKSEEMRAFCGTYSFERRQYSFHILAYSWKEAERHIKAIKECGYAESHPISFADTPIRYYVKWMYKSKHYTTIVCAGELGLAEKRVNAIGETGRIDGPFVGGPDLDGTLFERPWEFRDQDYDKMYQYDLLEQE